MTITRRALLKNLLSVCSVALLLPLRVWAKRPDKSFTSYNNNDVLKHLFGDRKPRLDPSVILKAPTIAENGALVPIKVHSDLSAVHSISLLVRDNPQPLAVSFIIPEGTHATISTRIRLAKTTVVTAVIETADGQLYSAEQAVKVTIGGCGG